MLRKLRVVLVVGAALLVAVVVGFVWYGRLMALRFKLELPKKLGLNITQESHHVTLSRSVHGKTVFTIRAADQVQRTNGMVELHDVGIELYGRQDGRSDKISGQEFLFDQKAGVMTGVGDVFIDLAAPERNGKAGNDAAKTVHVKTSGVTFNQAEQTAVTEKDIEFMAGGMTGTAVGAEYDAKSGEVKLKNQVHVSGLQAERPVVLTAAWADFTRVNNVVVMGGAKYTTLGAGGGESVAADHAEVHITPEGTPQRVDGQGHVMLTGPERGTMTGDRLELLLTEAGKARTGRIWGGVKYGYEGRGKKAGGTAKEVRVAFDGAGQPSHATAGGGVGFAEEVSGKPREAGSKETRGLTAETVDLNFGTEGKGKATLKDMVATGGAVMRSAGVTAKGKTATEVMGDQLTAKFVRVGKKDEVKTLDGMGHASVHQAAANGVEETSKGSALAVQFKPGGTGAAAIERAVQHGGVTIVRVTPAVVSAGKKVAASTERAAGDEAVYDGIGDKVTVSGGARVEGAESVLLADKVEMLRGTGDAMAEGNVRVSYMPEGGKGEPVHVTAARAVERKAAETADFYGVAGKDARMWQEGAQVQAPILSFSRHGKDKGSRRLVAFGAGPGDEAVVKVVLVQEPRGKGSATKEDDGTAAGLAKASPRGRTPGESGGPVRISGHEMTYLEGDRSVEFKGKVRVQNTDGVMTAQRALAYLAEKKAGEVGEAQAGVAAVGAGLMGGKVEKVVSSGSVEVDQPGRKGMGEQLVYTAADQTFVLTGTPGVQPKVVDEARGTTTGAVLRFRTGDDSVVISSGGDGQKVRSDTKVRQ